MAAVLAPGARAQSASDDERAVLRVVERLFEAMRTRDTTELRAVFDTSARLVSSGVRDGVPIARSVPAERFIQAVAAAQGDEWIERFYDPEVRIDGNLATVWTYYTFHLGSRFSHCGHDAFQLSRTAEGWKIMSLADSRRTEGCRIPDG
jgi:hypothetical protein